MNKKIHTDFTFSFECMNVLDEFDRALERMTQRLVADAIVTAPWWRARVADAIAHRMDRD